MFHIAQGITSPQTHQQDWVNYGSSTWPQPAGFYINVDTSNCGFTSTPHYMMAIEGAGGFHWYLSGLNCIYNATPNGFRVYLRWTDAPSDFATIGSSTEPNPLRVQTAKDKKWSLKWTGIQTCPCDEKELEKKNKQ